ncbi:probable cytochrome P450 305a1 isoform X2 [Pectinophora gossypiella]|uniref:probable cytochrome P450 305a1 isoform X2 n=1 Tax=Pectinophora gossypiella TaxID=13191 RepID=UPI00214EC5A4|nr:probable cytochrome P450 305a1 isoform X2 [Pectinophora gossypiella]
MILLGSVTYTCPSWYPFIGCSAIVQNVSQKYGSQWKGLSQLAKEHSTQVLGLKLGSELVVVVYGEKNLRQVFTGLEFEGRPNSFFIRLRCLGKRLGITFTDGAIWKEHRHFTVKHLRNVGFGKTAMEKEIQIELLNILQYIKNNTKSLSPKKVLAAAVLNVLWKYVAGERIEEDRLMFLLDLLNARSKAFSMAGGWLNLYPWSRFIFPKLSGYSLIVKMNEQISEIIDEAIKKHKSKAVEGNDFMYYFLDEINEHKSTFTEEQLKTVCLDLLIAGSQTTSNVLEFAFLTVLRNKLIQQKVFDEINEVLGDDMPCWSDTSRLIYTYAFLLEVQRYYTIVPLAGPRRALDVTSIDGYSIPKNTTILMAVGDLHFDPELWDFPHEFKPERFIDEAGALKNSEHMYPFGLGRRRCPGDSLAKSFIFIIFVGVMQKYKVECSNGIIPSGEPVIGLISGPKDYTADFIPRN